jgi:hypothetical protein
MAALDQAKTPEPPMSDAVYLLLLAALYAVTHALIWALDRLGKSSS